MLASALEKKGIGKNDTVAIVAPNIPPIFECHFAIPMIGAVMNPINIRLDGGTIGFILEHGEAKVLITDTRFAPQVKVALEHVKQKAKKDILVIDIVDEETDEPEGEKLGEIDYETFLQTGSENFEWELPDNEWNAISLNYTSGTTSDPKGVVVHHRGAYLLALGTAAAWPMTIADSSADSTGGSAEGTNIFPVHMYVVPMFHCNGWCHAWSLAATAGMSVLVRNITAKNLLDSIVEHRVTHFGGAPIVLSMLINATDEEKQKFINRKDKWKVRVYTAAAPPPPSVLHAFEEMGFELTHVYGLTETYGHVVECAPQNEWEKLNPDEIAKVKSRQGARFVVCENIMVANPETMEPIKQDAETIGEIMIQGNVVMKGYLKAPKASKEAFKNGWFHTGDLAVVHPDGYIEIKDRSKDIIISGGENISSVEIEGVLYKHPDVIAAAVVAKQNEKWGEVPCAFLELKPDAKANEEEFNQFCRENLAGFKIPKEFIFQELPKTSTGKIQKFILREQVKVASN